MNQDQHRDLADVDLLRRVNEDRALGCEILFDHTHASPDYAVSMIDLWRCSDPYVVIEVYRGGGKTTKAEQFLTLEGAFGNFWYLMLIGETYMKACQRLEAIDRKARGKKIQRMFGGPVLARKSTENRVWFRSGGLMEAFGWEQEFQSLKHGDRRPDRAYLDDIENKERVRDTAAVDAGMQKLYLELIPAMDADTLKIRFSQARRAEDCMVTRLASDPNWLYFAKPIADRDVEDPGAVSAWPEKYPIEWIRNQKRVFVSAGMLGEFQQEYMLQANNPELKPFKSEMFAEMELSPYHWMPRYVIYDPSRTTRTERTVMGGKSDRTGKVVVSRLGSKILVHESAGEYWAPDALIADLFDTDAKHRPAKIGIEKNSLDEWLLQPIRMSVLKRGHPIPITPLQAPQDRNKQDFILGLQPFFSARDIVLVGGRGLHSQLVSEAMNFPQGPDNVLNALAYSLMMFTGVPVYEDFSGANIGDAPQPRRGEKVYVGFNASPAEVVAVAVVRDGRRLCVAGDWTAAGATADAVKTVAFGVRTAFPLADVQAWVPADTYDQWQRIALVPAMRAERLRPMRGENIAVARGALSDRIRNVWHNARLLVVDKTALGTLNALGAGYAFPVEKGGRMARDPELGVSRLIAEALECMVSMLDKTEDLVDGFPKDANIGVSPGGRPYVTASPRAR